MPTTVHGLQSHGRPDYDYDPPSRGQGGGQGNMQLCAPALGPTSDCADTSARLLVHSRLAIYPTATNGHNVARSAPTQSLAWLLVQVRLHHRLGHLADIYDGLHPGRSWFSQLSLTPRGSFS